MTESDRNPIDYATPEANTKHRRDVEEYYRERPKLLDVSITGIVFYVLVFVLVLGGVLAFLWITMERMFGGW